MSIARMYILHAKADQGDALEAALSGLFAAVRAVPGLQKLDLLRDEGNRDRLVFIETWESAEAHAASQGALPKDAFSAVMAAIEGRPDAATYGVVQSL